MELKEKAELLVLRYRNMITVKLKPTFQRTKHSPMNPNTQCFIVSGKKKAYVNVC